MYLKYLGDMPTIGHVQYSPLLTAHYIKLSAIYKYTLLITPFTF